MSSPPSSLQSSSSSLNIQMVSKSTSERLLEKYFDAAELGFDYEKSSLWSPPVRRTVFLSSSGKVFNDKEMSKRLKGALDSHSTTRHKSGFRAIWCC